MRDADTAMYAAKDGGKNTIRTFEAAMHRRVLDRLELTGELQQAVEQRPVRARLPADRRPRDRHISGAEALVRWAHPQRGRGRRSSSSRWPRRPG